MQEKFEKNYFLSQIIESDLVSLNFLYYKQDTFHW